MVSPTSATAVKRKASTVETSNPGRTAKRRATQACHCCRSRKVRCDVVKSGLPCTNCRLDQVDCMVSDSRRRKKSLPDWETENQSPLSSVEETDDLPELSFNGDFDAAQLTPASLNGFSPSATSKLFEFDLDHHVPHMLYQTQGHRLSQEERLRRLSTAQASSAMPAPKQNAWSPPQPAPPYRRSSLRTALPLFIRPVPQKMMAEDIAYLDRKGSLTIPETRLRNELLRCYVQYVHPYMPLLDLKDFLDAIEKNDGTGHVGLLLFQAVMFAGTAFIDMRYLPGYESRKAVRKVFFQRTRLLYDLDYEADRISLVQALLLMTYWHETPDDQKDTWHWMGVSLSLAYAMGLHRNPTQSHLDVKQQRLCKRIWYSCLMADNLIALGMRRATRIKNEDCDVPMLVLDDFETEALSSDIIRMLGGSSIVGSAAKRRQLAQLCIEKIRLCLCISHVLASQYSVLARKMGCSMETTMMLVPRKSTSDASEIERCDRELDHWYQGLAEDNCYLPLSSSSRRSGLDEETMTVHRALLKMIYLTTSSALHRPQALPSAPNSDVPSHLQGLSRRKVREAAAEITKVAQGLYEHDLVRLLPPAGVTVLLPAVIIHLLDVKSNDPSVRNVSLRRLHQSMQILQRLREMYASADFATSFLEAAIRKANIYIPAERPFTKPIFPEPERYSHQPANHDASTPPPDAYASKILSFITLASGESSIFTAVTPPRSDRSRDSFSAGGASTSMAGGLEAGKENEGSRNEFDALIDFDAGADLFAGDDGLGIDLDMDWMGGEIGSFDNSAGANASRTMLTGDLDIDLDIKFES